MLIYILAIGGILYLMWQTIRLVWGNIRNLGIWKGELELASKRIPAKLEHEIYPPDVVQNKIQEFLNLNFRSIGECELTAWDGRIERMWIMVDELQSTHLTILIGPERANVSLSSVFDDGAWVQTIGEQRQGLLAMALDAPDFRRRVAPKSDPTVIYDSHQQLVAQFGGTHGDVQKLTNMDEYIQRTRLWASRYYPREIAAFMQLTRQGIIFSLIGLVFVTGLLVFNTLALTGLVHLDFWQWFAILGAFTVLIFGLNRLGMLLRRRIR